MKNGKNLFIKVESSKIPIESSSPEVEADEKLKTKDQVEREVSFEKEVEVEAKVEVEVKAEVDVADEKLKEKDKLKSIRYLEAKKALMQKCESLKAKLPQEEQTPVFFNILDEIEELVMNIQIQPEKNEAILSVSQNPEDVLFSASKPEESSGFIESPEIVWEDNSEIINDSKYDLIVKEENQLRQRLLSERKDQILYQIAKIKTYQLKLLYFLKFPKEQPSFKEITEIKIKIIKVLQEFDHIFHKYGSYFIVEAENLYDQLIMLLTRYRKNFAEGFTDHAAEKILLNYQKERKQLKLLDNQLLLLAGIYAYYSYKDLIAEAHIWDLILNLRSLASMDNQDRWKLAYGYYFYIKLIINKSYPMAEYCYQKLNKSKKLLNMLKPREQNELFQLIQLTALKNDSSNSQSALRNWFKQSDSSNSDFSHQKRENKQAPNKTPVNSAKIFKLPAVRDKEEGVTKPTGSLVRSRTF